MSKKIPNKIRESRDKPQTGAFSVAEAFNQACNAKGTLTLYRFVYRSRISFAVVLLLCLSFFISSVERTEASSLDDTTSEETVSSDEVVVASTFDDSLVTEAETLGDLIFDDEADLSLTENEPEQDEDLSDDVLVNPDEEIPTEPEIQEEENSNEVAKAEIDDAVEEDGLQEEEVEEDILVNPEFASSSEVMGDTVVVVESDSAFSFSKDECTVLASGSFYCAKPGEKGLKDDLFAAPDVDGDMEIYFTKDGVQAQVTSNQVDDAAPFYDKNSDTIVWHRLINDRYQIVSYDIESGEEEILTNTSSNNMEPNRQGKYTVWQRWTNTGWNIVLHDGKAEKQITKTTSHNVAPYIHGTLVVWNQYDQVNERTIEMYDIVTETFVTIEDPEGMSVANPRMVFVYDSLSPNGDIVTKGYDVFAKEFIDLDTLPRDLPEDIPESDTTGETRALIQNKPSGKSEVEELTEVATTSVETLEPSPEATSTPALPPEISDGLPTLDLTDLSPVTQEDSPVPNPPVDLIIGVEIISDTPQEIEPFVEPI